MNPIVRFCQSIVASTFTAIVLITIATSAHAIIVNIDPNRSSVTYRPSGIICDSQGNCGPVSDPQTFTLSGSFNVIQEAKSYSMGFDPLSVIEREEIQFDTLAIDSGGATALGFLFPTYRGVLSGETFIANDGACPSSLPPMTSCSSFGWSNNFSGTFDGTTLSMTGNDYKGVSYSLPTEWFSFTIVARVADPTSVSEPSTLACIAAAVIALGAAGGRRRSSAS